MPHLRLLYAVSFKNIVKLAQNLESEPTTKNATLKQIANGIVDFLLRPQFNSVDCVFTTIQVC